MAAETLLRLAILLVGVTLAEIGLLWRTRSHTRRLAELTTVLDDEQPEARALAADHLIRLGLDRAAPALLAFVEKETDPDVLAFIALAVGRRQWEPAASPGVADLRAWAATTLGQLGIPVEGFGPALTRLADMGGPRRPDAGPRPPAEPAAEPPSMLAPAVEPPAPKAKPKKTAAAPAKPKKTSAAKALPKPTPVPKAEPASTEPAAKKTPVRQKTTP